MSQPDSSPFPTITKSIENLIEDEGGTIPAGKMLTIGAFMIVFGMIFATEAFAAHSSHRSHSSHSSHSSGSGGHSSHYSHSSHSSHSSGSHSSHSSHSSGSHSSHSSHSSGSHSSGSQKAVSGATAHASSKAGLSPKDVIGIEKPESTPKLNIAHSDLKVQVPDSQ